MQVYELLAAHELYLQTDQPVGKRAFQMVLEISPTQKQIAFTTTLLPADISTASVSGFINPIMGLHRYQLVNAASDLDLPFEYWEAFASFGLTLYKAFVANELLYLSVQVSFDAQQSNIIHNAVAIVDDRVSSNYLTQSVDSLIQMGSIEGTVACVGSGAGLVLAAADTLHYLAQNPQLGVRAFVEIEEMFLIDRLYDCLHALACIPEIRIIVVTMYTIFIPCDEIAKILHQFQDEHPDLQIIAHLEGVNADAAAAQLSGSLVQMVSRMAMIAHAAQISLR